MTPADWAAQDPAAHAAWIATHPEDALPSDHAPVPAPAPVPVPVPVPAPAPAHPNAGDCHILNGDNDGAQFDPNGVILTGNNVSYKGPICDAFWYTGGNNFAANQLKWNGNSFVYSGVNVNGTGTISDPAVLAVINNHNRL